jgi:hypothetical protein
MKVGLLFLTLNNHSSITIKNKTYVYNKYFNGNDLSCKLQHLRHFIMTHPVGHFGSQFSKVTPTFIWNVCMPDPFLRLQTICQNESKLWATKTETVYFSETLVSTYKPTQHYNPADQHQHLHCHENFKSHIHVNSLFVVYVTELLQWLRP